MKLIDLFGREYGWTKSETEDLTFNEINFLIRCIEEHQKKR
jgi:hypothetical protein